MTRNRITLGVLLCAVCLVAGCTDDKAVNTAMGAVGGAAVGSLVGNGNGRTAAMITGAAVGGVIGNRAPAGN